MSRIVRWLTPLLLVILHAGSAGAAVEQEAPPISVDKVETATVRLVILDVVVVDSAGKTVPDLTLDDFDVVIGGKAREVDTLDVDCSGALPDPKVVGHPGQRGQLPPADLPRRLVLAFDYLHLDMTQRARVLDHAKAIVEQRADRDESGEEIMVVALNGGLRVEQTFTEDREAVWTSLLRMQRDITLWQPSFYHMNEIPFLRGMTTLFDVLATVPGPKAVVFFSAMKDVPLDLQFAEMAAHAAASRSAIYPVDVRGLWDDASDQVKPVTEPRDDLDSLVANLPTASTMMAAGAG